MCNAYTWRRRRLGMLKEVGRIWKRRLQSYSASLLLPCGTEPDRWLLLPAPTRQVRTQDHGSFRGFLLGLFIVGTQLMAKTMAHICVVLQRSEVENDQQIQQGHAKHSKRVTSHSMCQISTCFGLSVKSIGSRCIFCIYFVFVTLLLDCNQDIYVAVKFEVLADRKAIR